MSGIYNYKKTHEVLDYSPDQERAANGQFGEGSGADKSSWPGDRKEAPAGPMRGRGKNKTASYTREQVQRLARGASDKSITAKQWAERLTADHETRNLLVEVATRESTLKLGGDNYGKEISQYKGSESEAADRLSRGGLITLKTSGLEPDATGLIRIYANLTIKGHNALQELASIKQARG